MALASEFWWIAPTVAGAGTAGALGVRWRNTRSGRRLGYDAARVDLRRAEDEAVARRVQVRVARAEYARAVAERGRGASVDDARRALRDAEKAAKAAAATVRSRRAQLDAARAEMSLARTPERMPLARLRAAHEAVTARWMDYETDPAKLIAFPSMSDARDPATAAFLAASQHAQSLRPTAEVRRMPTEEFAAYRDAVGALQQAFEAAERSARTRAGLPASEQEGRIPGWQETAQNVITRSADVIDRATGAAASAIAAWNARNRGPKRGPDRDPDRGGEP